MNMNLYGFGPPEARKWIMLDCGVTFGAETDTPGIDVIMPDPAFIAERRRDLLGIVLTHGHEDHLGAVAYLWPQLRCPVYATPFTAALLRGKLEEEDLIDEVKLRIIPLGAKFELGPFALELITLTHSIPEPNAVAITTPLGRVLHTGDWKIDPDPLIGDVTDEAALRRLGEEGVLAMVCDSTNALVEGESGSEASVRESLVHLIGTLKNRIAVTAFASNLARLESVVHAAHLHGRHVALVGRAMHRITAAARETGFLDHFQPFIDLEAAAQLPRGKVLYLCTGSQGESGAALSRIARDDFGGVTLEEGDAVVYSSRVIPGNEKSIFAVQNALAAKGVQLITDRDHFIHVSGHPCRHELTKMYQWVRPQIAIPVHGEMRHMTEHARLAKELQVPESILAPNGSLVRLAPGAPGVVDEVPSGRLYRDGILMTGNADAAVKARKSLSFAGFVGVTAILDRKARLAFDPVIHAEGIPEVVVKRFSAAIELAMDRLTKRQRDDDAELIETVRRAVRKEANDAWGKRPVTKVELVWLEE
ncbi:MAG: ribonuclease J [Alphaproteobacteria bacterium]|nr:ribonuclease J [Alphaproteobacteria bacterium]